jgi:hypothetical protein
LSRSIRRTDLTAFSACVVGKRPPLKPPGYYYSQGANSSLGDGAAKNSCLFGRCAGIKLAGPAHHDGKKLNVADTDVPVGLQGADKALKLHIFLDRSVMGVFVNDGIHTVTRVVYPGLKDLKTAIFAEGGDATLKTMTVWKLNRIWKR